MFAVGRAQRRRKPKRHVPSDGSSCLLFMAREREVILCQGIINCVSGQIGLPEVMFAKKGTKLREKRRNGNDNPKGSTANRIETLCEQTSVVPCDGEMISGVKTLRNPRNTHSQFFYQCLISPYDPQPKNPQGPSFSRP